MAAEENRGPQAAAVAILFLALSWTAVLLRCYVRIVMTKSFGIDDWLAVTTLLLFTFYCTFVLDGVHYGTGRHITQISAENFIVSMKAWWIAELGYVSCTTILKLSIGFFLLRVCLRKYQRIIIWVVMAVMLAFSSYYFLLVILQCHPTSYFWLQYGNPEGGSCVDPAVISGSTYAHSAISAWADWTLGILPIFLVWDLKMNPRTKVSVALILALGALGSTATIVRIPFVHQLTETQDFLYANIDVSIWSTVEPGIGITASAMATMRPLFINFFSRSNLLGSSTRDGLYANSKPRARSGYVRSNGDVELGVNTNTGTKSSGITVTTVIESEQKDDTGGMSSEAAWPLPSDEDDARDRIRKLQVLGNGSWEVRGGGNASGNVGGGGVLNKTWNSSESRLTNSSYS